ncbi:MAG TPA: hypothetical protein VFN09_14095 [Rhodanobacteraceae bacterium]|nr:hypothetical protein [Rhodanobacteraceae bacterium]
MKAAIPAGICLLAGLTAVPMAATAATTPPANPSITALAARIQALEVQSTQLRQQADSALAAAHAAQAELAQLQADQASAKRAARLAAVTRAAAPARASGIGTGNAFNPAIAVILNGYYAHHSSSPASWQRAGFPAAGEGAPLPQGLSLGESELALSANIDDKFYGQLSLAVENEDGEDHLHVEEAYIDTTALPAGFGVRAGRFFSNIGYLNSHHAHTDFFVDRPLAYQALLGNQYGDDGVQVQWIAPTNIYLQLGGEAFRGSNYPAAGAGHGGVGAHTLFVHLGGDVGARNAWYAGISTLRTQTRNGDDGFNGSERLYIVDGTWKWSHHGNFKDGGLLVRGEYLRGQRRGHYGDNTATAAPATDSLMAAMTAPWTGQRSGAYLETVYQFNRTWNIGYRYDRLWPADSGPWASAFDPSRQSAMLTWHNSEFSLLRLQLSQEKPSPAKRDNAVLLQYQVALGAHGAHKF